MGKFDGILICTDLDGTLLGSDRKISKENIEAIEYFKSEGGLFTFITGRMPCLVNDIYNAIKPNAPFGCINGGGIYDGKAKYALMPVWILNTKYQDKMYTFAMNGQTGKLVGSLPIDKKKFWGCLFGIAAGIIAIGQFFVL